MFLRELGEVSYNIHMKRWIIAYVGGWLIPFYGKVEILR